jgi:integrase
MAPIKYDDKEKSWIATYAARHPETRRPHNLRRKAKSKAEAKRIEAELIRKLHNKFHEDVVPLWKVLVEEFIEYSKSKDLEDGTVNNRKLCLNSHTVPLWGNRTIDKITGVDIRNLIRQNLSKRSQSQQKNVLKYIRLAFEYAVESNYLPRNPTPKLEFKIGDKVKKFLSESQVRTLLETAKSLHHSWYPIWVFALYTGMRNGELRGLKWIDVNVEMSQIYVRRSMSQKYNKLKSTKSSHERIIDIAPALMEVITELNKTRGSEEFVLPRIKEWTKGEQARVLRTFLVGLGLPEIRFHDLRATWATLLLGKGVPPTVVMALGGWRDLKTMRIYVRMAGIDTSGVLNQLKLH